MSRESGIMSSLNGRGIMVWQTITPAYAAELLAKNASNRHVRSSTVDQYARDMVDGKWRGGDAPMTIREDGTPLDCQHRLLAIIKAERTIEAWVHIVPNDTAPMDLRVDTGVKRNARDLAGISTNMAAVARSLMYVAAPSMRATSIDTVLRVTDRIATEYDALTGAHGTGRNAGNSNTRAAACFAIHQYPADADEIARQFRAVVIADYGYTFWPAVASAMRQTIGAQSIRGHRLATFLRFERAFSPEGRGLSKSAIRDMAARRAELAPHVAAYIGL